jgi:hypothetical protein
MQETFQGTFENVGRALQKAGPMPLPTDQFTIKRHRFYHRQAYTTAATVALTFFNVAQADYVCNMPGNGQLPNDTGFWCTGVHVGFITGITAAGAVDAAGIEIDDTEGPMTLASQVIPLIKTGSLTLKIGEKVVVDKVYGLHLFPEGGGVEVDAAACTTDATSNAWSTVLRNGQAFSNNGWPIEPAYPFMPGRTIRAELNWQAAHTITTAILNIVVSLDGYLVTI